MKEMTLDPDSTHRRVIRRGRLFRPATAVPTLYHAGDRPGPGLYREIERGVTVRLNDAGPLPDLNSRQPSRFHRQTPLPRLLRWLIPQCRSLDLSVLYKAGEHVPAGIYQDVERRLPVILTKAGPLPNLQADTPSRYYRLRQGTLRVPRQTG